MYPKQKPSIIPTTLFRKSISYAGYGWGLHSVGQEFFFTSKAQSFLKVHGLIHSCLCGSASWPEVFIVGRAKAYCFIKNSPLSNYQQYTLSKAVEFMRKARNTAGRSQSPRSQRVTLLHSCDICKNLINPI